MRPLPTLIATPLTPGRAETARSILRAQSAQSIPSIAHSHRLSAPPAAMTVGWPLAVPASAITSGATVAAASTTSCPVR